jgi:hypothetical protein
MLLSTCIWLKSSVLTFPVGKDWLWASQSDLTTPNLPYCIELHLPLVDDSWAFERERTLWSGTGDIHNKTRLEIFQPTVLNNFGRIVLLTITKSVSPLRKSSGSG